MAASTYLPSEIVGMTQDGTKEITALFGSKKFSFPKPVGLIKYLIEIATVRNQDALVLDFFAGSGTTAQAVLELNQADNYLKMNISIKRVMKQIYLGNWKEVGTFQKMRKCKVKYN